MAGMYPTVHTEITEEVEKSIVADLLVNVMTKENNAHVYLNAYREAIYEKLFKLGRHAEYADARARIEEIKRKVRTEQMRVFVYEKREEKIAEYRYLAQLSLEDLQLPFTRTLLRQHILFAYKLLKDYRDDPEQGAVYLSEDELLEIVAQVYLDFILVAAEQYQLSENDKNKVRSMYFATLTEAAYTIEQQKSAQKESQNNDTTKL